MLLAGPSERPISLLVMRRPAPSLHEIELQMGRLFRILHVGKITTDRREAPSSDY
jgi:hypothetical protein